MGNSGIIAERLRGLIGLTAGFEVTKSEQQETTNKGAYLEGTLGSGLCIEDAKRCLHGEDEDERYWNTFEPVEKHNVILGPAVFVKYSLLSVLDERQSKWTVGGKVIFGQPLFNVNLLGGYEWGSSVSDHSVVGGGLNFGGLLPTVMSLQFLIDPKTRDNWSLDVGIGFWL